MEDVKRLYERLRALPWPVLAGRIGDFALYETLLARCADRVAGGHLLDLSTVPQPDTETSKAVAELRSKATLSADERAFLEYFELLEKIRRSLGAKIGVEIRSETSADVLEIEALTASAFLNAPHTSHTEQHIVNALRKAGKLAVSLVAETDGILIGHVAVSPVSISDGASGWFGLGPISVLPQHQHRGVGSKLMREALRALRERGAAGCVVLGEPEYYGRFGFQANTSLALAGVPPEYFQAISFDSSKPRGTVTYHEAFEARG